MLSEALLIALKVFCYHNSVSQTIKYYFQCLAPIVKTEYLELHQSFAVLIFMEIYNGNILNRNANALACYEAFACKVLFGLITLCSSLVHMTSLIKYN